MLTTAGPLNEASAYNSLDFVGSQIKMITKNNDKKALSVISMIKAGSFNLHRSRYKAKRSALGIWKPSKCKLDCILLNMIAIIFNEFLGSQTRMKE